MHETRLSDQKENNPWLHVLLNDQFLQLSFVSHSHGKPIGAWGQLLRRQSVQRACHIALLDHAPAHDIVQGD
jgi:hypothetical protein